MGGRHPDAVSEFASVVHSHLAAAVAEVPELAGCAADGPTYRAALEEAEVVIRQWIETAQDLGREIPKLRGRLLYA